MTCPPELNDLPARNKQQISVFKLTAKCLELSTCLAADLGGGAGRKGMLARIAIKIEESLRRGAEAYALMDHRCH